MKLQEENTDNKESLLLLEVDMQKEKVENSFLECKYYSPNKMIKLIVTIQSTRFQDNKEENGVNINKTNEYRN